MNPDYSSKVSNKIEELCKLGCTQVNRILEKSQSGDEIEELSEFDQAEIRQIINELGNIMSVYDKNSSDNKKNSHRNE